MRNIAIRLAYVGTSYHGWQAQKDLPTVSRTVERAVQRVVGHPVSVVGCGRTDAGVHAETYVANFRTGAGIPAERLPFAINTMLPDDIAVLSAGDVPESFNAIGSCVKKEYTYKIYLSRLKNPFYVGRMHFYPRRPDTARMQRAAADLEGRHDFAAFCAAGSSVKTTVRTVYDCRVTCEGNVLSVRVAADGFLYNMVRTIVGTLLYVSEGKLSPDGIPVILGSGDRNRAGPTAPACGLYMTGVWYGDGIEI